jgi:RNA polymerase-binding transcription factor DksA
MPPGVEGADGPSALLIEDRIQVAFKAQDDARRAYLDRLIFEQGTCRYCGAEVMDKRLAASPGLCSRRECKRRAAEGRDRPAAGP